MFNISQKTIFFVKRSVRFISQFRIPLNDCKPQPIKRTVHDPKACKVRDKGLVLGIYSNEDVVPQDRAILTTTAQHYDKKNNGKLSKLLKLSPTPGLGEVRVFYDVDPDFGYVAVAGLGTECLAYNQLEQMDESKEAIRIAAATGSRALQQLRPSSIYFESFGNAEASAEGASLGLWRFQEYRTLHTEKLLVQPNIYLYDDCDDEGWKNGKLKAESQNLTRYLQEMPPNYLNPTAFAKIVVDLLCELDINVDVKTKGWATSHDMGGFSSIGKSSVQPPLYVEISYFGANECARPVVLIGKGVTFNSGGLDLKPCDELRYMRGDMAGAACVVSTVRAAALQKLPINIRGILPLCEIMPNGKSTRHGDVVDSANGQSVLIRLPAYEDRLIMADSLVHARTYWPHFIMDIGTMSKELMFTLGAAACGCYANDDDLFKSALRAGCQTGDRVWRMPLWKFYENKVRDLTIADIANTARTRRNGDSPICAAFLNTFICDSKWIHLDTYNVGYTKGFEYAYLPRGMTGRPTRTVIQLLNQRINDSKLE